MLLSRLRPKKKSNATTQPKKTQQMPELEDYLIKKDYQGAISLLEFKTKDATTYDETASLWLGHCYFRSGDYRKASEVYEAMIARPDSPPEAHAYLGCCFFYLGMYSEARQATEQCIITMNLTSKNPDIPAPKISLFNRLMFHISHKLGDEKRLMTYHQTLGESLEDQLSLASIHYMRMHYAEAVEIYKSILTTQPSLIALNVYMAMCYYKMDFFDVAQDVLAVYVRAFPDSPAALNLKACISYKAYTGKSVIPEMEALLKSHLYPAARELIRHNLIVFKNGDGALQVLPSLMDTLPEARLNMILYYLKRDQIQEALSLCNELEPQLPYEFLIKAITFTLYGQKKESKDHLKTAEQFFKMVGESAAECDTIPGRQSMASSFFLKQKYDEVLVYLHSIKDYHQNDDMFSLNLAQSLLACKQYKEAEENFLKVTGPERDKPLYKFMLARSFIYNNKPQLAWDIWTKTRDPKDAANLLRIIALDCYKATEYYHAAKAFDILEKSDPSPDNWNGKRGATAGLFRQYVNGRATKEQMTEILVLVDTSHHPHAEFLASVIRNWATAHRGGLTES